jgi:hypothetical protein
MAESTGGQGTTVTGSGQSAEQQPSAAAGGPANPAAAPAPSKAIVASLHTAPEAGLPLEFTAAIEVLEAKLNLRIVLFIQQGLTDATGNSLPFQTIDMAVAKGMRTLVRDLPKDKPVALLIESPGGYAREAYIVAKLLHRHCGGFTAIIPQYAKSAATLLALGADRILMHDDAELGPIDAQVFDYDRERRASALDEVQSLERLHAQALNLIDSTMLLLIRRSRKRTDVVMPHVLKYVAQTMKPLFEKIDTVHFTAMSRTLKVAEAYAIRLLSLRGSENAGIIAERLVYEYPDHGFVIDHAEARAMGLSVDLFDDSTRNVVDEIIEHLDDITAIGSLTEREENHGI